MLLPVVAVEVLRLAVGGLPVHRVIVAALEAVDFAFIFKEKRNKKNIQAFKPDFYIKAGDYKLEELTSKEDVEKYGGIVRLIPVEESVSTTEIINKIRSSQGDLWIEKENTVHLDRRLPSPKPAIFLDRDGTITEDVGYLHDPGKLKLLDKALQGVRKLYDIPIHSIDIRLYISVIRQLVANPKKI